MFQNDYSLATIAKARQDDLFAASNPYHVGSTSPSLLARARRNAGMALIAAGERLADRKNGQAAPVAPLTRTASPARTGQAA